MILKEAQTLSAAFGNTGAGTFDLAMTGTSRTRGIWLDVHMRQATDPGPMSAEIVGGEAFTLIETGIDTTDEVCFVYGFFLGHDIPTGAFDIRITWTDSQNTIHRAMARRLTGVSDLSVIASGQLSGNQADPQIALDSGTSPAYRIGSIFTGTISGLSHLGPPTTIHDYGSNRSVFFERGGENQRGNITVGFTGSSDDVAMVAAAIVEDTPAGPYYLGKGAFQATIGETITPPLAAGAAEDDLLLLVAGARYAGASSGANFSATGYDEIAYNELDPTAQTEPHMIILEKIAGASESAPTLTSTADTNVLIGLLLALTGYDAAITDATPVDSSGAAATTFTPTGITTVTDGALVFSIAFSIGLAALTLDAGNEQGFVLVTDPGGDFDTALGQDFAMGIAVKQQDTAGAVTMPTWSQGSFEWIHIALAIKPEAGGGTAFQEDVAGSITGTGALARVVRKNLAGTITPVGTLERAVAKAIAGAVTSSGQLTKATSKGLAGETEPSGDTGTHLIQARELAGSITGTGTLSRTIDKFLAGTSTAAGHLRRAVEKTLTGASTPEGDLALVRFVPRLLEGAITASGALQRAASKTITGTATATGALAKRVAMTLAGETTPEGDLALRRLVMLAIGGTITASGRVVRFTRRAFTGSAQAAGSLARAARRTLAGSTAAQGALTAAKTAARALAGTITATGALVTRRIAGITGFRRRIRHQGDATSRLGGGRSAGTITGGGTSSASILDHLSEEGP